MGRWASARASQGARITKPQGATGGMRRTRASASQRACVMRVPSVGNAMRPRDTASRMRAALVAPPAAHAFCVVDCQG
eukprot:1201037-Pyramimonas_sp.AAC.1